MRIKNFAVIGHPIGHSMSPFIHRRLLELAGTDGTYTTMDVPPDDLPARWADTLSQLDGFNVTTPHKHAVLPLLSQVGGDAARFGSVNTVAMHGGISCGYTTDGIGFTRALSAAGLPLTGDVLLLGSGGVARVFANEILRAPAVTSLTVVMRRHPDETPISTDSAAASCRKSACRTARKGAFLGSLDTAIMEDFAARCPHGAVTVTDNDALDAKCAAGGTHFSLLVNGTSAGMYPKLSGSPISDAVVSCCSGVFDAVYNPGVTMLLKKAMAQKIPCAGGMGMLVWQAAAAEEIWLGCHFREEDVTPIIHVANDAMRMKFGNVILCGFMGSGKSTVGGLLANQLNREFVDMDAFIEQETGMTVPQIFAEKGETYFRSKEAEACCTLSRQSGLVIAAGGGTLTSPENAAVLRETGIVVLLDPPYGTICQRLVGDHTRPLLEATDRSAVMERLYQTRMPLYRAAADFTVSTEDSITAAQQLAQQLGF